MNSKRLSARHSALSVLTVSLFVIVALTIPQALRAQEVGATLSGSVIDPNGLGIPAAGIAVMNQATGITVKIVSGDNGEYIVPSLTPGTYRLTVEKAGFRTAVLTDVTLVVFQRARLDIHGRWRSHIENRSASQRSAGGFHHGN